MRMLGNGMLPQIHGGGAEWWSANGTIAGCVAAYQPKGAAGLAESYTNLANPGTYTAAPGVAPTLDINGWSFNGSTQYLTTGIIPNGMKSMIVRFSGASGSTAAILGASDADSSGRFILFAAVGANRAYGYSGLNSVSGASTSGVMALAENNCYLNGAADGITAGSTITSSPLFIGARNFAGAVNSFLSGKIQALAIYSTALTSGEVSTLTTLMNAL